ncbi:MAG: hypothetical protein ABI430_03920 [Candidatus Taylorbacteria bacterium]
MSKSTSTGGGFKTLKTELERKKRTVSKQLNQLRAEEKRSRARWTKGYLAFLGAATQLSDLKHHGTKKERGLVAKIKDWPKQTIELTKERDAFRDQIRTTEGELVVIATEHALLVEKEINDTKTTDEIVTQVLALNDAVVRAASDREECLNRHIFPRLIDEHGNLRSQLSFTSSDGLNRVVAMVNTMTIVRGDLAAEAKLEIERFFDRFKQEANLDAKVKPLYELTRQLLVEKTNFKVGPDLYRFLAMHVDADVFPELATAQTLLRQSIRSEKTSKYIRIYKRKSVTENWVPVPQS